MTHQLHSIVESLSTASEEAADLDDFTDEVQRRAREDAGVPTTPDQIWENVNAQVPGMLSDPTPPNLFAQLGEARDARKDAKIFVKQLGSVKAARKYIKNAMTGALKYDTSGTNRALAILDALKHMPEAAEVDGPSLAEVGSRPGLVESDQRPQHGSMDGRHRATIPPTPESIWNLCESQGTLSQLEEAKKGMPGTVQNFLTLLSHKIARMDEREQKRAAKKGQFFNHHALANYIAVVHKIEKSMKSKLQSSKEEDLRKLQGLIGRSFIQFSPANFVVKAIDTYLQTGKGPTFGGKGGTKHPWG